VERSIAWLVRGNRRVRYRGVIKNHAWLHHRIAGLNSAGFLRWASPSKTETGSCPKNNSASP
jgi:hypothetical protein